MWVEMDYRHRQTAVVDHKLLPENTLDELDEHYIRPVAREMALKLLVELQIAPHLGSDWKTIDYFLRGLEASAKRNWWQAIANYRQAIQAEESHRGTFGVGHYHLGAALVFQGNVEEGEPHILTAEHDGPTMAETQYLLALIRLINRWSNLHEAEAEADFQEIDRRLERALRLKPDFAEAYQLRATAHYQRARTLDRNFKYRVEEKPYAEDDRLIYISHYRHARRYFFQALRRYDQKHTQTVRNSRLRAQGSEHVQHLTRQRMTAAHQLADSLRALGHYAEAESYYRDMEAIYLRNARNLADIAKTYCLSANWQTAEEFLWQDALKDDTAMWDADINMHVGWALAGGIVSENQFSFMPWLNRRITQLYRARKPERLKELSDKWEQKFLLGEAMQYLDFAIHQRPRYLDHWRQSDWYNAFTAAHRLLKGKQNIELLKGKQNIELLKKFDLDKPDPNLFNLWLELRIARTKWKRQVQKDDADKIYETYNIPDTIAKFWEEIKKDTNSSTIQSFQKLEQEYVEIRNKCSTEEEKRLAEQVPFGGISNHFQRLRLAQELYKLWEKMYIGFYKLTGTVRLSFAGRWALDLLHETALLCCRMLAASEAYELLEKVARKTIDDSDNWLRIWKQEYVWHSNHLAQFRSKPEFDYFTFSPRVNRYQRVALRSYLVYARYQCAFDPMTVSRIQASRGVEHKIDTEAIIDTLQPILAEIRLSIPIHPLYLYTQALVYYKSGLHGQAIETLERLLDVIAPMDPKRDVGGNIFGRRRRQQQPSSSTPRQTSNQEDLGPVERISGRQQFQFLIGRDQVHILIANIFKEIDKVELSIRHLMEAVRWSPHNDLNVDIFLRLADELSLVERYRDAQAVIEAIRIPRYELNMVDLSEAKRNAPDIMECVINTRRTNYSRSLVHGKKIAHRFRILTPSAYIQLLSQTQDEGSKEEREKLKEFLNAIINLFVNNLDYSKSPSLTGDDDINRRVKKLLYWKKTEPSTDKGGTQTITEEHFPTTLEGLVSNFQSDADTSDDNAKAEIAAPSLLAVFTTLASDKIASARTKDAINRCALFARFAVSSRWRTEILAKIFGTQKKLPMSKNLSSVTNGELEPQFAQVMFCHAAAYFAEQGLQSLEQIAEICNSLAFNRAETGLHIEEYAKQDSATALAIMAYLYHISDRDTEHYRRFSGHLAQYCDTYGWLHYRMISRNTKEPGDIRAPRISMEDTRNPTSPHNKTRDFIELAERFLQMGLRYDPVRSIIHFHLARIYLARVELVWQLDPSALALEIEKDVSPQTGGLRIQSSERKAVHIDRYLNEAFRAWREADKHDEHRRLHPRLVWLYNRISAYRRGWDERQLRAIAGITDPGIKSRGNETESGSLSGR
jgi:hypothetical protein